MHHEREVLGTENGQIPIEFGCDHLGGQFRIAQVKQGRRHETDGSGPGDERRRNAEQYTSANQSNGGGDAGRAKHRPQEALALTSNRVIAEDASQSVCPSLVGPRSVRHVQKFEMTCWNTARIVRGFVA